MDENTTGQPPFDFNISKWKKTKTTLEAVAENIIYVDNDNLNNKDAVIIYYSDTQTLKITFTSVFPNPDNNLKGEFNGTKQP